MSRYKNKVKPVQAAGYRVSGVSSNLGKVCREVRGQFRGQFIKGMSQEGCLAIGSQVDLETRSESRRMESAAEISQVSTLMALNAFLGHGRFTSKGLVPRSAQQRDRVKAPAGGGGGRRACGSRRFIHKHKDGRGPRVFTEVLHSSFQSKFMPLIRCKVSFHS